MIKKTELKKYSTVVEKFEVKDNIILLSPNVFPSFRAGYASMSQLIANEKDHYALIRLTVILYEVGKLAQSRMCIITVCIISKTP